MDCHPDDQGSFGRGTYKTSQPHFPEPHTRFFTTCAVRLCSYVRCSEKEMSRFCRLQKQQTPFSQIRNSLEPRTREEPFSLNESTGRKSRTRLVQPRVGDTKRTTNKWGKQVENYEKRYMEVGRIYDLRTNWQFIFCDNTPVFNFVRCS